MFNARRIAMSAAGVALALALGIAMPARAEHACGYGGGYSGGYVSGGYYSGGPPVYYTSPAYQSYGYSSYGPVYVAPRPYVDVSINYSRSVRDGQYIRHHNWNHRRHHR